MRSGAEHRHRAKVERIAAALRSHDGGRPLSLRKRSAPHQVPKAGDLRRRDDKIDVRDLTEVLHIDRERRVCVAESGVTFADVVAETLPYGLVPMVVPELEGITLGGAVAGCSLESMSFRYGGFHDTCLAYEILTAKGEVIRCDPHGEDRLLFEMMHGTFGTLGILTALTFRLTPAAPYVHVIHEKYGSLAEYEDAIERHYRAGDIDFMDGIIHEPPLYVLCAGRFVDRAPYTHRYDWMRVYHRSTATRSEDYLTTRDYFFRYDRGVTNVHPSSFLGRLFFGKLVSSSRLLRLAEVFAWALPEKPSSITVDLFVPASKVQEFFAWYDAEIGFYPLWCVAYRRVKDYPWLADAFWEACEDELFLDIAIYGMRPKDARSVHRRIERELQTLGGLKTLISHNYYSEKEFWETWNRGNYQAVKARTDPNNTLRDLYDKTCRAAMGRRPEDT